MRICSKCGAKLTGVGPPGLCPKCFLQEGLAPAEPDSPTALETSYPPTKSLPGKAASEGPPGQEAGNAPPPHPQLPLIPGYDVLRELNHGGQGIVYEAVQKSTQRNVAIKVLLEGPYASEPARRRFEREIELVSHLKHPNIITVFDRGVAPDGRLYYVMDYVLGKPLMAYVHETKPTMEQALGLFAAICEAVNHAHQHGVIHRDLKPSNILIDTEGNLHVLDFGLAKAITEDHQHLVTLTGQVMGTLPYMSPEQARGGPELLDVRTDVYALGVILYQMLTGAYPYPVVGQMAEVLQHIAHTEPKPPTRSWTRGSGIDRSTRVRRHTKCPINNEVETIVLKALAKERERRYQGAGELAKDVRHYLANEPIEAKRDSGLYVLKKTLARHRVGVSAAAAILAILAASSVIFWQQRNEALRAKAAAEASESRAVAAERQATAKAAAERSAREESEKARKEAEAITAFLTGVLRSPDPGRDGRTITVVETLDSAVKNLDRDLGSEPALRAHLQATLALTYNALGLRREAIPLQEKARDYYLTTAGPEHPRTLEAIRDLARSYGVAGRLGEALDMQEETLRLNRKVKGPHAPHTLAAMNDLAVSDMRAGRRDEALKLQEEALALWRIAVDPEHRETIGAMNNLAASYYMVGRRNEGLKLQEELVPLCRTAFGPEHPDTLTAMHNLAGSLRQVGRLDEALKMGEEVLRLSRKVYGPEHPDTLDVMGNLAGTHFAADHWDEALKLQQEVLRLSRKANGPEHPDTLLAMHNVAGICNSLGRREEALQLLEELLPLRRKVKGPDHADTIETMNRLAGSYYSLSRREEAIKLLEELVRLSRTALSPTNRIRTEAMTRLASLYNSVGRPDEGLTLAEEVLALCLEHDPNSREAAAAYSQVGFSLDALKRREEAIKAWQEAVRIDPAGTANVHFWLGQALVARKRYAEALPILRATRKFYPSGERAQQVAESLAQAESKAGTGAPPGGSASQTNMNQVTPRP